mmetsp:Transcript_2815/g.5858  ORF Transcript_2815/g.5858 Transcript_2815/m.5858 type:complete len:85 (-) Transcript_2815:113-367(-)
MLRGVFGESSSTALCEALSVSAVLRRATCSFGSPLHDEQQLVAGADSVLLAPSGVPRIRLVCTRTSSSVPLLAAGKECQSGASA